MKKLAAMAVATLSDFFFVSPATSPHLLEHPAPYQRWQKARNPRVGVA